MGTTPPAPSWRITLNPERMASIWWDAAKTRFDAPPALKPMLDPFAAVELDVTPEDGAAILAWASRLPDWDEGQPPLLVDKRGGSD
jgi:hypothetical protein